MYFETEVGKMGGKVTDWSIDDDGLPLTNSKRRGIITDNYQIEPFFDYYGKIDETQSLDWKNRSVLTLLQNDVDLTVLEKHTCSQVEDMEFFRNIFTPSPQDPY